jgi:hypothetical protein
MRRLSPNEYATIKQLLDMGHSANKVAEIVGRSLCVVSTAKKSISYAEYIRQRRAQARRAEENRKAQQLPLDTPKKTTLDLREDLAIKLNAFRDAIVLYKHTATGSSAVKQIRYCQKAQERLEEAWLWLKESF